MSAAALKFFHPLWVIMALSACGGGGSDDASTVGISYSPGSVTATGVALGFQQFTVLATITNPPATAPYVLIVADKPVIVPGDTSVRKVSASQYSATFTVDSSQPAGTYTGNFTLYLCSDSQCANKYATSGEKLPYQITVLANPVSGVVANGSTLTAEASGLFKVHVGDIVTIDTNTATTWTTGGLTDFAVLSSTPNALTIKILASNDAEFSLPFTTVGGQSQLVFEYSGF